MSEENPQAEVRHATATFMDMLSHDIVNDHQAVLTYLELVLAERQLDPKLRAYAQKAVSHVRAATIAVENAKRLGQISAMGIPHLRNYDLTEAAVKASADVETIFPSRSIKVKLVHGPDQAMVVGDDAVEDLILTLLVNAVRLDPVEDVELEMRLRETKSKGRDFWTIEVEDKNAKLPSDVKLNDIEDLISKDSSVNVKMSGIMFAKIVAKALGGDFEAGHLKPTGATFRVCLRKAVEP